MPTKAHQIAPARCKKATNLDRVLEEWQDPDHDIEVKEDGNRYELQVCPNNAPHNYLTSRRVSVQTNLYVEKQDKVPLVKYHKFPLYWADSIFDGEWCVGKNSADAQSGISKGKGRYVVWDIIMYRKADLRKMPRAGRKKLLLDCAKSFPSWMTLSISFDNVVDALAYVKKHGKEGLVRKTLDGEYGEGWTKATATHLHDVIIWGYYDTKSVDWQKKGWIGALRIGQWKRVVAIKKPPTWSPRKDPLKPGFRATINGLAYEFTDVGRCSGFTAKRRAEFSKHPSMFLNSIIKIKCKERIADKFRHPRFMDFHHEKNAFECVF